MKEVIALQEEMLEKRRQILSTEHPDILMLINNLIMIYYNRDRKEEAVALQEEALEKW